MSEYRMDVFTSRRPNSNANIFVGEAGRIFYDQEVPILRLSDSVTPGGIPFVGGGSGGGNVTQIVAGANINISPVSGVGVVTINATGGSGTQGPQGNQGSIGPQGNQGSIGPQGNQGSTNLVYYDGGTSNTAPTECPLMLDMGESS